MKKIPKLYTTLIHQPDGSWLRCEMPTTLKEAKESEVFNRCLAGFQSLIVDANEQEIELWKEENLV